VGDISRILSLESHRHRSKSSTWNPGQAAAGAGGKTEKKDEQRWMMKGMKVLFVSLRW
jgi:hypothetical protein